GTHECVRDTHVPPGTRGKSIDALLECAIRRLRYSRACAGAMYPQTCSRRTLRREKRRGPRTSVRPVTANRGVTTRNRLYELLGSLQSVAHAHLGSVGVHSVWPFPYHVEQHFIIGHEREPQARVVGSGIPQPLSCCTGELDQKTCAVVIVPQQLDLDYVARGGNRYAPQIEHLIFADSDGPGCR